MNKQWVRAFSSSGIRARAGYSTVEPVHHLVDVRKAALSPKYKEVLIPKDDITSLGYKPTEYDQDRVQDYYQNTLQSDLMLMLYDHEAEVKKGIKIRPWEPNSPYALYRNWRKPRHVNRPTQDVHPISASNIPELQSVSVNLYCKEALVEPWLNISARLQMAQITNVKPKLLKSKVNYQQWKIRKGRRCGCKAELTGLDMSQFVATLTELVLPRIRTFKGIKASSGDTHGNITFGLDPEDVKFFPEIENFQDLYPNLFGFHITFKTSARTDDAARTLLSSLGLPFESK